MRPGPSRTPFLAGQEFRERQEHRFRDLVPGLRRTLERRLHADARGHRRRELPPTYSLRGVGPLSLTPTRRRPSSGPQDGHSRWVGVPEGAAGVDRGREVAQDRGAEVTLE